MEIFISDIAFSCSGKSFVFELYTYLLQALIFFSQRFPCFLQQVSLPSGLSVFLLASKVDKFHPPLGFRRVGRLSKAFDCSWEAAVTPTCCLPEGHCFCLRFFSRNWSGGNSLPGVQESPLKVPHIYLRVVRGGMEWRFS